MAEDFVVTSPLSPVAVPDVNVYDTFRASFAGKADKLALVDTTTGEEFSYKDLEIEAEQAARRLYNVYGVRKGSRVALCAPNSARYVIIMCAVIRLGGASVGINHLLTAGDIHAMLNDIAAELVFTSSETARKVKQAVTGTNIRAIISADHYPGCVSYESLVSRDNHVPAIPVVTTTPKLRPREDLAFILFSSGTTGAPKPVGLSHFNVNANVASFTDRQLMMCHERQVIYQPMSHVFGLSVSVIGLAYGATSYVMSRFDLRRCVSLVAEHKVTVFHMAPPVAVMFAKAQFVKDYDLSHVTTVCIGAGPISVDTHATVAARLPATARIKMVYGMTELTGVATAVPHLPPLAGRTPSGSCGVLVHNTQAKVVDLESDRPLGPNKEGEILIRGPQVVPGYVNRPHATAALVDAQGWLRTGDIGRYDEDGFFFITDRLKDLIKYKGYQVSPLELEHHILSHPDVEDAGVFSIADDLAGELPRAWVVQRPGSDITESQIASFIDDQVAPFKKLRGGVRFVPVIPRSASGKIIRREMVRGDTAAKL